ncbi:MAG: HlyD family secretion protein [Rhodospirillales bacterium]|nr:HlyD family secretion protein [Rhodospirillales bacterium]
MRPVLMGGGVLVVAIGGLMWWLNGGRWVETDDAYVQADTMTLSTDVSGIVTAIPVHEGEEVKRGQVLFQLDPQKFQIAVDNAQANLAQTRLSLEAMKADYQGLLRDADSRQQQVNADQATYDRLAALVKQHAVTQQQTDDARFKLAADQQALDAARMQAKAELAKLGGNAEASVDTMPAYHQALAQLDEALREQRHATIRAPYAGIVTQVNKLQIGMFLGANTAAFGLVSTEHVWVEAQPKETQLTYARSGDHVKVSFDIYPNRDWDGVVQSIAPATDQEFSLLPAQNSSGNWVKVVQRLPVRIRVDRHAGDPPLRAGMSATVDIDTGHSRTLADLF